MPTPSTLTTSLTQSPYQPKHHIRILTATSLFDGHDAAIHIMRRILQATGAEIIHIGHNRSAEEIVRAAIEEDVQAIAITSYQGGHMEFFTYICQMLQERNAAHIQVFGGGGGTILPEEIEQLHTRGVTRIYAPDDGRRLGLQGMINDLLQHCDYAQERLTWSSALAERLQQQDKSIIARLITMAEVDTAIFEELLPTLRGLSAPPVPVIGITGTGGAGKSSLTDELLYRYLHDNPKDGAIAVLSVDPSRHKTGGALLGDRIRMNTVARPQIFMRSMATRQAQQSLSAHVSSALAVLQAARFDLIFLESAGVGQVDTDIVNYADVNIYAMTPEYGAPMQLEKINMLDYADVVAVNKADKPGSLDAMRDVKKQYQRNHQLFDQAVDRMPVFATRASQFNDQGVHKLYQALLEILDQRCGYSVTLGEHLVAKQASGIPAQRASYLLDVVTVVRDYNKRAKQASRLAQQWYALEQSIEVLSASPEGALAVPQLQAAAKAKAAELHEDERQLLQDYAEQIKKYAAKEYTYEVRGKQIKVANHFVSLAGLVVAEDTWP